MKKSYLLVLTLAALLSVSSCGESSSTGSSVPDVSGEPNTSEVTPSEPSSQAPEDLIPEGFVENLNGTYYGKEGTLQISKEKVVLDGKEYYPTKHVVEDFNETFGKESRSVEHAVTYLRGSDGLYRVRYKGDNNRYQLALEKLGDEDLYETVSLFMPTIEEFRGVYSDYGDGNQYNTLYFIESNFNFYRGAYDVGLYSSYMGLRHDTHYLNSYKTFVEGELKTLISYNDWADNYEYHSLIKTEEGLYNDDWGMVYWYDEPLFLTFPYFASEDNLLQGSDLNVADSKVTFNNVEYSYTFETSEQGQVVNLTADNKSVKVTPTQNGLLWEENNQVTEYVYDSVKYVYGNYQYGDLSFELKDDDEGKPVVLLNGEEVEYSYAVNNHSKAVKVNVNGEDYYFAPFNQDVVLLVDTPKGQVFFINVTNYSDVYAKTFVNKGVGTYKELEVTEDFTVAYDGKVVKGNLFYDGKEKYPHLEFSVNSKDYKLSLLDLKTESAVLECEDEKLHFISENVVAQYYDSFVTQYEDDLVLSKYNLSYFGETYDYSLEAYYSDYYFSYYVAVNFKAGDKQVNCVFKNKMVTITETRTSGLVSQKTAIARNLFDSLVGTYYFDGEYGPEKLKLTSDGHFYADTEKASQDGLIYDVEYTYTLSTVLGADLETVQPIVTFYPIAGSNVGLNCVKTGNKLMVGDVPYTVDYLFNINGVYVDENNLNVVEVREDKVYVNGTSATIKEVTHDERGTYVIVDNGFSEVKYSFSDYGDGVIYPSSNENGYTEYSKVEMNYSALLGEYVNGTTTYTLSRGTLVSGKVEYGYVLSDGFILLKEYGVVLKDGYVALKFTSLSGNIYLYLVDGQPTLVVESTIPLPPGPPIPTPPPLL